MRQVRNQNVYNQEASNGLCAWKIHTNLTDFMNQPGIFVKYMRNPTVIPLLTTRGTYYILSMLSVFTNNCKLLIISLIIYQMRIACNSRTSIYSWISWIKHSISCTLLHPLRARPRKHRKTPNSLNEQTSPSKCTWNGSSIEIMRYCELILLKYAAACLW